MSTCQICVQVNWWKYKIWIGNVGTSHQMQCAELRSEGAGIAAKFAALAATGACDWDLGFGDAIYTSNLAERSLLCPRALYNPTQKV